MTGFLNELKQALRRLAKTPGFTLAALIVLALGIGANTAIFSIVNGVLLRPLPYSHPDRLVQLYHVPPAKQFPGMETFPLSAANYLDWERQNGVFENSAIYAFTSVRMTGSGDPKVLQGSRVETSFFPTHEAQPMLGRTILPGDEQPGHEQVIVLSHKLWKSDFGANLDLVGKYIELNGQAYAVIGVMPATFDKPGYASFWTPLVWD